LRAPHGDHPRPRDRHEALPRPRALPRRGGADRPAEDRPRNEEAAAEDGGQAIPRRDPEGPEDPRFPAPEAREAPRARGRAGRKARPSPWTRRRPPLYTAALDGNRWVPASRGKREAGASPARSRHCNRFETSPSRWSLSTGGEGRGGRRGSSPAPGSQETCPSVKPERVRPPGEGRRGTRFRAARPPATQPREGRGMRGENESSPMGRAGDLRVP